MGMELKGLRAMITGGSSGMGFEMAKALLSRGAAVTIAARPGEKLDRARTLLEKAGEAYAIPLDVRDEAAADRAAAWYRETFGGIDLLVNNAGVGNNAPGMVLGRPFYEIPAATFRTIVETNFTGYFLVSRAFVPMMAEQGRGRIVNVSTSTATMTRGGSIPYGPSRAGAEALSAVMAADLRDKGITVNVICPGGVTDTGMTTREMRESLRRAGRGILPADILNPVILFLASPAAEGITGEKIVGKEFNAWLAARKIVFHER